MGNDNKRFWSRSPAGNIRTFTKYVQSSIITPNSVSPSTLPSISHGLQTHLVVSFIYSRFRLPNLRSYRERRSEGANLRQLPNARFSVFPMSDGVKCRRRMSCCCQAGSLRRMSWSSSVYHRSPGSNGQESSYSLTVCRKQPLARFRRTSFGNPIGPIIKKNLTRIYHQSAALSLGR